jgi:DNA-binding transcriptional LysR family regulator
MVMDILREYVAFSKHLNISAAARELNISQPTLSKHLMELERELNTALIVHGKDMRLTPAGKIFLKEAGLLLHQFDRAKKKIRDTAHYESSVITIEDPISFDILQQAIGRAIDISPEFGTSINISLVSTQGRTAIEAIVDGLVDIAFVFACPCTPIDSAHSKKQIIYVPLAKDRLRVRMNPDHPLAQKESIHFRDLQDVALMVPANKVYDDWRTIITEIFAKNGLTPNFNMRSVQTINEFSLLPLRDEVMLVSRGSGESHTFLCTVTRELVGGCNEFLHYAIYDSSNPNPRVPLFVKQISRDFEDVLCKADCPLRV